MIMKHKINITLGMIYFGLIFNSCDKDDNKSNDFRDKYIGKYQVKENMNCYGACGSCSYQRDTVIGINYGLTDSTLNVLGRDVYLDSTGSYYSYHYGLRLWNDSISSTFMNGGLGCGRYETYKGFKISNKP